MKILFGLMIYLCIGILVNAFFNPRPNWIYILLWPMAVWAFGTWYVMLNGWNLYLKLRKKAGNHETDHVRTTD